MKTKLNEVVDISSDGIFTLLVNNITDFDLWNEEVAEYLDLTYLANHSGEKWIAPIVEALLSDDDTLSEANLLKLAKIIYAKYHLKWEHQLKYLAEYNPIHNYDMVQVETPNITRETDFSKNTDITTTTTDKVNEVTQDSTYGFNSTDPVNTDTTTVTRNPNDNVQTVRELGTDTANNSNEVESETGTRTLTRQGNIGVTTTAQMLEGDSTFWEHWSYWESVFNDCDKILTLDIY